MCISDRSSCASMAVLLPLTDNSATKTTLGEFAEFMRFSFRTAKSQATGFPPCTAQEATEVRSRCFGVLENPTQRAVWGWPCTGPIAESPLRSLVRTPPLRSCRCVLQNLASSSSMTAITSSSPAASDNLFRKSASRQNRDIRASAFRC